MIDETTAPYHQSETVTAHDRLRLIHLFVWMTVAGMSLALTRWLKILGESDSASGLTAAWLAVTFATAICAWPWYFARRRRRPRDPLMPGERLWLLLVPAFFLYPWACLLVLGLATEMPSFALLVLSRAVPSGLLIIWAVLAAKRQQPLRWRLAFSLCALGCLCDLAGFATGPYWILEFTGSWLLWFEVCFGEVTLWGSLGFAGSTLWDLLSRSRSEYRWSHWVGCITFISTAGLHAVWQIMFWW
jgi:hypothetical protein